MAPGCDPGGDEWKELFLAAEEFRTLAPWRWMDDTQLFGVRNPWTGEVGWCVVMGAAGLAYGLAVYRGEHGYATYRLAMADQADATDTVAHMDCLLLEFCSREKLTDVDRNLLKKAGLKPSGRRAWPLFRSYLPWHLPWYLTSQEARYMELALRQACLVAARLRKGPAPPLQKGPRLLVREPQACEGGWVWRDTWVEPSLPGQAKEVWPAEEALQRVLSACARTGETWEVDVFPAKIPVSQEGERPRLPPTLLVSSDGFPRAVYAEAVRPPPDMWEELLGAWFRGALRAGKLPRCLRVKRDEVAAMLGPTARLLGIPLEKRKKLRTLEGLRRSLEQWLARRR